MDQHPDDSELLRSASAGEDPALASLWQRHRPRLRRIIELQLEQPLSDMDAIHREIIALRHFEELSNAEAAQVLSLTKSAASKRYVRALTRLQSILEGMPGFRGSGSE